MDTERHGGTEICRHRVMEVQCIFNGERVSFSTTKNRQNGKKRKKLVFIQRICVVEPRIAIQIMCTIPLIISVLKNRIMRIM